MQLLAKGSRGVYLLWLRLPDSQTIEVGALGVFTFTTGYYAYVGSAQNGLAHRLRRHVRPIKPLRWHIDYLRAQAELTAIHAAAAGAEWECRLAAMLRRIPGAEIPVSGFGSSDCRCISHLYYYPQPPEALYTPQVLWSELLPVPLDALKALEEKECLV